ncbi:MAG: hypothetical protein LC775_10455, partial [Acidobacteria bacterium]|nr:hypothetical protein [Acidobacteriota bacterium]
LMTTDPQFELEELGLAPAEAQAYLALIRHGALAASAVAGVTQIPRSSVYPTLNSLVSKGLVEGGAGYGSRFTAIPAEQALPALIRHEKEQIAHREALVKSLSEHLAAVGESSEAVPRDLIQVIRSPRAAAERFNRLQLEAEREIAVFNKPPFMQRTGNPTQDIVQRRGVHYRAIFERSGLNDPAVRPFLNPGEEARAYGAELPQKLAIFDSKVVLVPLIQPGQQIDTLFIRHRQLAETLRLAFEYLWERSEPMSSTEKPKPSRSAKAVGGADPGHPSAKEATDGEQTTRKDSRVRGSNHHRRRSRESSSRQTT